ncbi:MAG: hypothetical protein WCK11_01450 [Candidatus Falkowbacteria bacterium]
MRDPLRQALELAKKTGDRLIVFDRPDSDTPFVIMGLADYEKIALVGSSVRGLTEEELVDKINRDIALWKSDQDQVASDINPQDFLSAMGPDSDSPTMPTEESTSAEVVRPHWSIKQDIKQAADEVIEEDRQYLETVQY